jgi:hypothetical protein
MILHRHQWHKQQETKIVSIYLSDDSSLKEVLNMKMPANEYDGPHYIAVKRNSI